MRRKYITKRLCKRHPGSLITHQVVAWHCGLEYPCLLWTLPLGMFNYVTVVVWCCDQERRALAAGTRPTPDGPTLESNKAAPLNRTKSQIQSNIALLVSHTPRLQLTLRTPIFLPAMLRNARPLLSSAPRLGLAKRAPQTRTAQLWTASASRPSPLLQSHALAAAKATSKPLPLVLWKAYSTKPPITERDKEFEKKVAAQKLEARPDEVSVDSSVRHVIEESQAPAPNADGDVLKDLKGDLHTFKEAFALDTVPRDPYMLGLAGTLPYLGTSIATVFLSWNLNTPWPTTSNTLNSILLSHDKASELLNMLEPIQIGYGAVLVSFLGAIHWGLEFAEKSPLKERTKFRYAVGVVAPIVAWPTMFFPIEWALTTQFLAFTGLYFADSRATTRGWAPAWYGSYRWVLTAVVGVAIFISLVGRAKVGQARSRLTSQELRDSILQRSELPKKNWAKEEEKERQRIQEEKEAAEKKKKEEEKKQKEEEKKKGGKKGSKKEEKQDGKKDAEKTEKEDSEEDAKKDTEEDAEDESGEDSEEDSKKKDDKDGEKDEKKSAGKETAEKAKEKAGKDTKKGEEKSRDDDGKESKKEKTK
ncbi:hypothetical protein QBC39DRAFT_278146 [Podospora conica]|nr:hypothetical protein QBC39DRAFT_278146 [Schizothecium conicum]